MRSVIEVKDLIKKYKTNNFNSVDTIDLTVKDGEFFAFLGPNGAGKTTTISILTTLLSQTSGTVNILGLDNNRNTKQIRENIGIIFQKPSLDEQLTGEENIRLHVSLYNQYYYSPIYKFMSEEYKYKLNTLADMVDIKNDLFNKVKTYSGGMKRKIEVIRSLMHTPKILFLDEPTTGLDPESRENIWNYLKTTREKFGITIFLTTHYLEEADNSDNLAIINKGKIIYDGDVENLKTKLLTKELLFSTSDNEKLQSELTSKDIKYTMSNNQYSINIDNNNIQNVIKTIDTPISNIDIKRPTLEQAYLALLRNHGNI